MSIVMMNIDIYLLEILNIFDHLANLGLNFYDVF